LAASGFGTRTVRTGSKAPVRRLTGIGFPINEAVTVEIARFENLAQLGNFFIG
jgi:hypothetical protein